MLTVFLLFFICLSAFAQERGTILLTLRLEQRSVAGATVELLRANDSSLVKVQVSDTAGRVQFSAIPAGSFFSRITGVGFEDHVTRNFILEEGAAFEVPVIYLQTAGKSLSGVTVIARKPFIELHPDKTVVNVEANIGSTGTTALEALEKMPGITVDRDGNISLKGRAGVMILIDGKQTYLSAAQLQTMLSGMSAAQITQVELMDQPPSRYDAAGNAGVINIKTKKTGQRGFNGSLSTSYGQGFYPKSNNNLQLNIRQGKINFYLNYSYNRNGFFTRLAALRTYLDTQGQPLSFLDQPSFFKGVGRTKSLRTGVDFFISNKTTIGFNVNGMSHKRDNPVTGQALWMGPDRERDSFILTRSTSDVVQQNYSLNINLRNQISSTQELTVDVDALRYRINTDQSFQNVGVYPIVYTEASRAGLPTAINIISGKADYSRQLGQLRFEGGWKSSHINTDNEGNFEYLDGSSWKVDPGRTNHFLYRENIHAAYSSLQTKVKKWSLQGGLRYEFTEYSGNQLGNGIRGDSSFSKSYNSLFPTLYLGYTADSIHSFNLSAGRRIDRPPFQKLNPFLSIINKYTYQRGNPFYRPQYTWNIKASHLYKDKLSTSFSYSVTKDYFLQIFPRDSAGIIIYTEGNLGRLRVWTVSTNLQMAPARWWNLSAGINYNYKIMEGTVWQPMRAEITQFTINLSNQLRFSKGWSGEVSGFFNSRSQVDIQEILDPAGQLTVGIARQVLAGKGTVRIAARDIFHTQWMKGFTWFEGATESFKLERDTQVITVSFTYRFGKAFKSARRSEGAATEEAARVN
jgi:hypothetical protein